MSKQTKAAVPREQEWLNGAERALLQECEAILMRGAEHDVERGQRLALIRDRRLYRASHASFEAYCAQPQWRLSRSRAYQLMDLAGVAAAVHTVDSTAAISEAAARELAPLRDPEAIAAKYGEAVELHGDQPTAVQVREVVRGPEDDLRFSRIENAAASLNTLPPQVAWPVEDGDVEAMDKAFESLAEFMRRRRPEWRAHKAALKASKRHLHAA